MSDEQGKTVAAALGEYRRALENLRWNGENAERLTGAIAIDDVRQLLPEPVGIVAAFTPWNYPAILKAAEETPSSAVFMVKALMRPTRASMTAGMIMKLATRAFAPFKTSSLSTVDRD